MRSPKILLLIFLILSLSGAAMATYGGDNPLNATYSGDISGGYLFDMGDSFYQGSVEQGDVYNVTYSFDLPADAQVKFQRLYVYWGWSRIGQKAAHPGFVVYDSRNPGTPLPLLSRYSDSKGFVSSYDFYSGMDAYQIQPLAAGHNAFNVTCIQAGLPNSSVIIFGIGVLAVYEHGGFKTYTGAIDKYPGPGETVDLYAMVETIPPTETARAPVAPGIAAVAVAAAAALIATLRRRP